MSHSDETRSLALVVIAHSPRRHFPHLDGFVARSGEHEIAGWHERHRGYVVVVPEHRLEALEGLSEVPQFD